MLILTRVARLVVTLVGVYFPQTTRSGATSSRGYSACGTTVTDMIQSKLMMDHLKSGVSMSYSQLIAGGTMAT